MKMIQKTTIREIKGTFGRFFAILSIVALGTGFFTGVRITTPAMIHTVNAFLEEKQFYDYRLISTLGWNDENVSAFQEQPEVRSAEGANTIDVLYTDRKENEFVFKTHTLLRDINQIQLAEGRLPENPGECLLDAAYSGLQIGDVIDAAPSNDQDTLDCLNYDKLTIVGTAWASYYVNFERGTTSIGNGSVAGYLYVLPEAFDLDYYSEIFIRFDQDYQIYSQNYKDYMEAQSDVWETIAQKQADSRYDSIMSDAEQELQDGKEELREKREEGEQELDDARQELDDARQELDNAQQELKDAEQELQDGRQELDDARQELDDARIQLDDAERELADVKAQLDDAEQELADVRIQLDDAEQKLADAKTGLDSGRQELDDAESQIADGYAELEASEQQLLDGEAQIQDGQHQLDEARNLLEQSQAELDAQKAVLNQSQQEFDAQYAQAAPMWDYLPAEQQQMFLAVQAQLQSGRTQIEAAEFQLNAGWYELNQQQAMLDEKKQELENGRRAFEAGKSQLEEAELAYQNGLDAYEEGLREYEEGLAEFENGKQQYEEGLQSYEDGKRQYEEGLQSYEEGKQEYEDGLQSYEEGKQSYEDGLREYEEGLAEFEDGKQKYADGQKEYQDGLKEFDEKIADAEQKISDAEQEIADIQTPDVYVLDRNTNIGYTCFESDSEIVEQVARVFPVFFILVAALVCMTTMSRMVEEQRTQIGTLKALGYSESAIMGKFMFYSGSAALLGCVLGYAVGTALFPKVIWMSYELMYMPLPMGYVFDAKLAVLSVCVALLCSIGTTWISCRYELSETAAGLMRPKAPKAGKRVFLEKIPFIWNRLKFLHKVSVRNIFRYKGRFFMMVIGISGCTALLITGFGLKDSVAGFADVQYEEILVADASVSLKSDTGSTLPEALKTVLDENTENYVMLHQASWDLITKDKVKSMTVMMPFGNMEGYMNFHTLDDTELPLPGTDEAIISNSVSERFGVNTGDEITLRNEDMQELHLKVTGVFENHVYNYIFLVPETLEKQLSELPEYNTIYINFPDNADIYQNSAEIAKNDDVVTVTLFQDLKARMRNMTSSLNYVVLLVIACAAGLAFIVLYNLTNINITERIREIATIKVLGFFRNETSAYVLRENIALTAIGIACGLLLGVLLHRFVMRQIIVDLVSFKVRILPISFVFSIILTFVFNILVNLFMELKLERINMAESLKSVD